MATEIAKTVISEDIEVTGSIKAAGSIQFDGKLNGDMTCNGNAVIGQKANIKGNLSVDSITIIGQVSGNITAKDRIELKSTARISGDIKARRLTVEDGVTFIGKSEVNPSTNPSSSNAAPAPEHKQTEPDKSATSDQKEEQKQSGFFGKR